MHILVTGASGFFGSGIVSLLRASGHDVLGVGRRARGDGSVESMDVTSRIECDRVLSSGRFDAVVHAAGLAHIPISRQIRGEARRTNVEGTRNVCDAAVAHGVRKFIYISSVSVYGATVANTMFSVSEDALPRPHEFYGVSKQQAEQVVLGQTGFFQACILRMATMYSADWLLNIRKRVAPPVVGKFMYVKVDSDTPRYSLCSLQNGSRAVEWALEGRLRNRIYNVADRYDYSQSEILNAVSGLEGSKPTLRIPSTIQRALAMSARALPLPGGLRAVVEHQYWKYCGVNLYSTDRLHADGFSAPPHLLTLSQL